MAEQTVALPHVNDWHRLLDQIGTEHRVILQGTLPTPSFGFLLEAKIRDCKEQLTSLSLSREPVEFKNKYHSIKLQQELAQDLLTFVKSLSNQSN